MAHPIRIPRLGWSMEEGTFVRWLKQPGETVAAGEPLFELEGEKALQQVESIDFGVLHVPDPGPTPGATLPVGALLGYLLALGEPPPSIAPAPASPTPVAVTARSTSPAPAPSPPKGERASRPLSPAERRRARLGGATPEPLSSTPASSSSRVATPRARRAAQRKGLDWRNLVGTGRDGRVREADVLAASTAGRRTDLFSGLPPRRRIIAQRLHRSQTLSVPVTLVRRVDATQLVALRQRFSGEAGAVPTYSDLAACLAARALSRHLPLAVRWDADHTSLSPVPTTDFHIGIAVDTPDGLLVPVVRNVLNKAPVAVAAEAKTLVETARAGRLAVAEMSGGVLTISNLGGYGVDAFTPVLNAPEILILGLGAIRNEAVALDDGSIVARKMLTLSLTFDHAAIDGAPAAAFLQTLALAFEAARDWLPHP